MQAEILTAKAIGERSLTIHTARLSEVTWICNFEIVLMFVYFDIANTCLNEDDKSIRSCVQAQHSASVGDSNFDGRRFVLLNLFLSCA